jgi:nitroimidazol reductase NimA-like FMN-containing flavoprotein (pyridoxamine 5'-phosphate oxidase superfamily)
MADTTMEALSYEECLQRLRAATVCRLAVVVNDFPVVVPVNYRLMETLDLTWIALRTRPGNVIDQAALPAALEIDEIDVARHEGWSVLVRGTLHHLDPDSGSMRERFDSEPWLAEERDAWMVIQPFWISGRRLRTPSAEWAFERESFDGT